MSGARGRRACGNRAAGGSARAAPPRERTGHCVRLLDGGLTPGLRGASTARCPVRHLPQAGAKRWPWVVLARAALLPGAGPRDPEPRGGVVALGLRAHGGSTSCFGTLARGVLSARGAVAPRSLRWSATHASRRAAHRGGSALRALSGRAAVTAPGWARGWPPCRCSRGGGGPCVSRREGGTRRESVAWRGPARDAISRSKSANFRDLRFSIRFLGRACANSGDMHAAASQNPAYRICPAVGRILSKSAEINSRPMSGPIRTELGSKSAA